MLRASPNVWLLHAVVESMVLTAALISLLSQCRDENGFKCHLMSEGHQRQMSLFADNADFYLDTFSEYDVRALEMSSADSHVSLW